MKEINIINGPNMNSLGEREIEKYGKTTLKDLENEISKKSKEFNVKCNFFQTNIEGEIVTLIQNSKEVDGIILNAAAYSHYSIAIRDAILAIEIPVIEVHMTNIFSREDFRRISIISPVCKGVISGFGINSYLLALIEFVELEK